MKYAIRFTKTLPDGHVEWSRPEGASQISLYAFDRNGHQHWLADFDLDTGRITNQLKEYSEFIEKVKFTDKELILELA